MLKGKKKHVFYQRGEFRIRRVRLEISTFSHHRPYQFQGRKSRDYGENLLRVKSIIRSLEKFLPVCVVLVILLPNLGYVLYLRAIFDHIYDFFCAIRYRKVTKCFQWIEGKGSRDMFPREYGICSSIYLR